MTNEQLQQVCCNLSARLKAARQQADYSQTEVAAITGINRATINRMEQGRHWPNLKQYVILCDLYGIALS